MSLRLSRPEGIMQESRLEDVYKSYAPANTTELVRI